MIDDDRSAMISEDPWSASRCRSLSVRIAAGLALSLVSLLGPTGPATGQEGRALRVDSDVPRKTYYVGQAIELRIGVEAGSERPQVVMPRVAEAEVAPIRVDMRQLGASGIGDVVTERIYYIFRYRIVPRRAGLLIIPPVAARLGERSGAGASIRLSIRNLPPGRPSTFLGGVGRLDDVEAEAEPATVRAGQSFDYRIRLEGPAARGSTQRPELEGFDRLHLALEIGPGPDEATADPPFRVFRYRIRPTRAGEAVLPPVRVASFDPELGQYLTRTTPGVPIRVVDVPKFDPTALDYGPPIAPTEPSTGRGRAPALIGAGAAVLAAVALAVTWRRYRRARRDDPVRLIGRHARLLEAARGQSADRVAGRIDEALVAYLALATGRPRGALTPDEASRGIEQATGDPDLASRAGDLISGCDRARYGGRTASAEALVTEGLRFLHDLTGSAVRATKGEEEGDRGG